MKTASILISNCNSFDAIQLCIESIRARTDYPNYQIIVHDDESPNGVDIKYLEEAEAKGWIRLIRGNRKRWAEERETFSAQGHPAPYWHGCAVNILINETCQTDLAMLLDCDIFIKNPDWLSCMAQSIEDDTLVVAAEWPPHWQSPGNCVPGWYRPSFCMINMKAYHDGMEVDWRGGSANLCDEPYKTLMRAIIDKGNQSLLDQNCVRWDPGTSLWIKMLIDNPKQYKAKSFPGGMEQKFHHFGQLSVRLTGVVETPDKLLPSEELELMRSEFAKLRGIA